MRKVGIFRTLEATSSSTRNKNDTPNKNILTTSSRKMIWSTASQTHSIQCGSRVKGEEKSHGYLNVTVIGGVTAKRLWNSVSLR
ncbi:hypothetical protein TNCV_3636041 [Trichonephila clavipes]|nr:hypothetical protein TNCV_3636041 [Trichonephila clavipes]